MSFNRRLLSLGLADQYLQSESTVTPYVPLLSVRSNHWCDGTSNFCSSLLLRFIVPMSQLYVACGFDAVRGNVAFSAAAEVFQSMTFENSTRLPASPVDSRIV